MAQRHIYIDEGVGETRGVVAIGRRPERLLIRRADQRYPDLGARYRARVIKIERGTGLALLDLGEHTAALRIKADRPPPIEGQALEVEISIEPQGEKDAVIRLIGMAAGAPGRLSEPPSLRSQLEGFGPDAAVVTGPEARIFADLAEDQALTVEHPLGAGSLSIEATRALTAVDIDLGSGGGRDPKRAARETNLAAIAELARLLRLKAIGGLVVIDLVGRGHDGAALARAAQTAFAADQPGVIVGPVTKFGTLELALPRRLRPIADILCGKDRRSSQHTLSHQSLALRLCRAIEREGRSDPGGRILARCAPQVAAAIQPYIPGLTGTLGARFEIMPDLGLAPDAMLVSTR